MADLPQRKQIRLKDYDYSKEGAYFITICVEDKHEIFAQIVGADDPVRPCVKLTDIGKIVDDCWNEINNIYENVYADKYCIMPDHFHGIIIIQDTGGQGRPPLHKIVQGFKSVTTRMCFKYGFGKIWQRSYYDHIIRDKEEYWEKWKYIDNNPLKKHLGADDVIFLNTNIK